jgi:cytochrome c
MDDLFWNKIFGAVLGTGLFVFALKLTGGAMFGHEKPEKPGFAIAVADDAAAAGAKPADAAPKKPLAELLAAADKGKGEATAKQCGACHDFTKGGPNKVGPNLYDVVGRAMGSAAGFTYSDGFKAMGGKAWDYESLDKWVANPKEVMPGTKMAFSGIHNDQDRANVLAYLGSLSDSPKPFPAK